MKKNGQELVDLIIEGIQRKKGKEIVRIDLSLLDHALYDDFIICHGDSNTQVDAIAGSVEEIVKENNGFKMHHLEGRDNSRWILMDYFGVIVHIFQKEYRDFYNLESLWGDAKIEKIEE